MVEMIYSEEEELNAYPNGEGDEEMEGESASDDEHDEDDNETSTRSKFTLERSVERAQRPARGGPGTGWR